MAFSIRVTEADRAGGGRKRGRAEFLGKSVESARDNYRSEVGVGHRTQRGGGKMGKIQRRAEHQREARNIQPLLRTVSSC